MAYLVYFQKKFKISVSTNKFLQLKNFILFAFVSYQVNSRVPESELTVTSLTREILVQIFPSAFHSTPYSHFGYTHVH